MNWCVALATTGIAIALTWPTSASSAQRCLTEDEGEAIGKLLKSGDYKGVYDALIPGARSGCSEKQFALGFLMHGGELDMTAKGKKGEQEEGYAWLMSAAALGVDQAADALMSIRDRGRAGFAKSGALSDCWQRAYGESGDIDRAPVKQCLDLEKQTALWPSP